MTAGPDLLRVSVVRGPDRVDLVVPAAVCVADLLPEVTRQIGSGDPLAGVEEAVLSVLGGSRLDPAAGLGAQGVPDGALLTLTDDVDHAAPETPFDDDLAAVVAAAVETVPRPPPGIAWWAGLGVAAGLLGLGGCGTLLLATASAAAASGLTALVLLAAVALGGRGDGSPAVVVAAWLAVVHAGAAGLVVGAAGAGAAWAVAGAAAALASRRLAPPLWGASMAGAVVAVTGVVAAVAPGPFPVVATVVLVVVVATGDLHPWLAATVSGLVPPPLGEDPPTPPDRADVTAAVRRAHRVLPAAAVATGLVLLVLAPVVAGQGPWGLAVALLCCAVVALRSRRHRIGTGGVVGLLSGLVPSVPVALAVWWTEPGWRLAVVGSGAAAGLLVLAAVARPVTRSPRAGRLAELAEALTLVALPPVALAATGLLDLVRAVVG